MRRVLGILTVLAVGLGLAGASAVAGERPPIVTPYDEGRALFGYYVGGGETLRGVGPGMQASADEIIADQCPNGGWNWPHGGCATTYNNITGPICMGLMHAYPSTSDPDHKAAAVAGGNYDLTFQYGNGEYRFGSFAPAFLRRLTALTGNSTYSDHAATKFFDELTAKTYGPADYDTAGWIAAVQAGRTGAQINIRPWDFQNLPWVAGEIGNANSTTPADGIHQQVKFRDALLDGLNTLDNTDPNNVSWDMLGLAGGVRGLALNGTTSFTAIVAPKFTPINGKTTLCQIAAVLAGYQNADGSWYWSSNLGSPVEADKDTQTTAYAVMALLEADVYCTDYSTQIAKGRDWLRSMQLPGGGFLSYPGGDQNIEVEGEALNALDEPSSDCTPTAVALDQTPIVPLTNPTAGSYSSRYVSGFGSGNTFTVFFEDRNQPEPGGEGYRIAYVQSTTGPTGFPTGATNTNIYDTHFCVKDWPITIGGTPYAYRAWGSVGNNPSHRFYVSNDLTNWTTVSTFTIPSVPPLDVWNIVYYGFHDVILLNGTYYAWAETNQGTTVMCRSTNGGDVWEAFASVGGSSPAWGPLQTSDSPIPTGSFFDLGNDNGYGKLHIETDRQKIYLAVNTAARATLPPAALEAAFIDPNNWTWHDGTTGLPSSSILQATAEHDYRECWLVPRPSPSDPWVIMYDADYVPEGKSLGYATLSYDSRNILEFRLASGSECVKSGETVTVELWQRNLTTPVRGFQAWGQFDSTMLTFLSGTYNLGVYGLPLISPIGAVGNNIDMAAGIDDLGGQSPTSIDTEIVSLSLTAGATEGPTTISFRFRDPPSRFTDATGQPVTPCLVESATILIDNTAPVIQCPVNVVVDCGQSSDPWATGVATANDNLDDAPVVTYSDDRSGLTLCNATGVILRTWKARDCAGNESTCVQTVTLVDTGDPVMTACPSDIEVNADAGVCTAVVTYACPTAVDTCYFEGFEDLGFVSGGPFIGSGGAESVNWNDYNSHLTRVLSGIDGIPSKSGAAHGYINSTVLPPPPDDDTGAFSRLRGYSSVFGTGFRTSLDVYINLADPAVAAKTYGWDLSSAVSDPAGAHRRDFIFHAAADDNTNPGNVLIAASNNSNFTKRNDLETINHYVVSSTGWYTFEWVFRDFGDGTLAVDCNLRNAAGTLLWTETRHDSSDVIGVTVGGNRYMWFTFLEVAKLAIDNTRLIRNVPVVCTPPSGSTFATGTTPVTAVATDACGNTTNCWFNVKVNAVNELKINVQLSPTMVAGPITRCITFELWKCPDMAPDATVNELMTFTSGSTGLVTVLVPCGDYTCITARDKLHTLRRTDETFGIVGTQYVADFTGDPGSGGDWLIGGNLNDDYWIDILDFGVFSWKYGTDYGTGNTTCATTYPHADVSGDGLVSTPDFTFIGINFLKGNEANCCGQGGLRDGDEGPITRISVAELRQRGLGQLAIGDLNHDGWLDEQDIIAFLNGTMPDPDSVPTQVGPAEPVDKAPAARPAQRLP